MVNLGNAWHIPTNPEPRGRGGMLDPVGAIVPGADVTVVTGNQFQGGGNPGNQLQDGSLLAVRRLGDPGWAQRPMTFLRTEGNNKYYRGSIPSGAFQPGDVIQYYLRVAYDDHDTTFLRPAGATSVEADARNAPFMFRLDDPAIKGRWEPVLPLPDVGIHAHMLPDGRVLLWGRRPAPKDSLDVHQSRPFVWDPLTGTTVFTPQPTRSDGTKINLFCSGHAFLPDGRLLVVGGHLADGDGLDQAATYDWRTNTWTASAPMTTPIGQPVRRWYPTVITMADGNVLVLSGSFIDPTRAPGLQTVVADLLQIWHNGTWTTIDRGDGVPLNFIGLPLYPRLHAVSTGQIFMSGPNARTLLLTTSRPGGWTEVGFRALGQRDYCPAVMYDVDRVIYLGGGNNAGTQQPTNRVEIIDLTAAPPRWRPTGAMNVARRHHNAVILPDGHVLVVGGTRGGGGPNNGFNDLGPGQPVHTAEMWDPRTGQWTELSAETNDRCYHSTAVLLPDGRVLSAGGGEYRPDNVNPNDPQDTHRDAQIFAPPYLFRGPRPEITSAPTAVGYGDEFPVGTGQPDTINLVTWIRLPSVTHSSDENQRINFLTFRTEQGRLMVTAPATMNECPPGHYMLFILSADGVPSVARMVQIRTAAVRVEARAIRAGAIEPIKPHPPIEAREAEIERAAHGTAVVVGVTGTCPYGIGSCWGGAYEALGRLEGVDLVSPVPDVADSTAQVFLEDDRLPDLDAWEREFPRIVNGTYQLRGVEVRLRGRVEYLDGRLVLAGSGERPPVSIVALTAADKVQWDHNQRARRALDEAETRAFERLRRAAGAENQHVSAEVTGPLTRTGSGYQLHLREFAL
jgi:galactose oxidase